MKDGGPAYPNSGEELYPNPGMTMRQRYKLAAPITDKMVDTLMEEYDADEIKVLDVVAFLASRYAEAMLLEDKQYEQGHKE